MYRRIPYACAGHRLAEISSVFSPVPLAAGPACYQINVTHISPVAVTEGIIAGASRLLKPDGKRAASQHNKQCLPSQDVACTLCVGNGRLVFYGPFAERGVELTEGNAKFNATLHSRGLGWGLREVEWVTELATTAGLELVATVPMPANNLSIVYSKPAAE